ncbi:MAG: hypothetical protein Q9220_005534 [cf. Caloplaca sp. 1 TL-2023]
MPSKTELLRASRVSLHPSSNLIDSLHFDVCCFWKSDQSTRQISGNAVHHVEAARIGQSQVIVMAVSLSVAAICGIAVGGAAFIVIMVAGPLLIRLRKKHMALVAASDDKTKQRPRAHLSITDEDVFRMPGTRRIRPSPYDHSSGWIPISSKENLPKRGLAPNPADVDPITGLPPWPVRIPRRLKKAQSTPHVRMPLAALSPITERSTNNTASPSIPSTAGDLDSQNPKQPTIEKPAEVYLPTGRPPLDSSPGYLQPKPLFHGQARSFSHSTLVKPSSSFNLDEETRTPVGAIELDSLQTARMPRVSSLCSQRPGQAPEVPVPPLPIELPVIKKPYLLRNVAESSPRRVSGVSLLSGDTSVLDETGSRAFSQAETDFTSISLTSPLGSQPTSIGLGISTESNAKWNFSRVDRSASPISVPKVRSIRPQMNQQHSFRASVHDSLPRSASSGLSMSLLDRNSPCPKPTLAVSRANLDAPGKTGRKAFQAGVLPQGSPLNVFQLNEERKAKRASTSVLQVVSGNQSSPVKDPWVDRPTSIATEDPFRWDPKTTMQQPARPSAMKTGARRHKRQSCVRISNIPIVIDSRYPSYQTNTGPSISPLSTSPLANNFRPPSLQTFNPRVPNPIPSPTTRSPGGREYTPYSPTFSMIPLYANSTSPQKIVDSSPSSSLASTPTRNPSRPARNPNRKRAVYPPHGTLSWPPLLSSSITPSDPPSSTFSPPESPSSRPPSFLFHQFPDPPARHHLHTIRGPRPLPPSSTSIRKRRSPTSSLKSRRSSVSPRKMNEVLRSSILELRRMNSEVCSGGADGGRAVGGHGRYLSLGDEGEVKGLREMEIMGAKTTPVRGGSKREGGRRTPGSLYDGDGFLLG